MASRHLKASGGDHPTMADWEAWVTDPANFGGTDWDDTTSGNGGDQILRFADEIFTEIANTLTVGALATATYYKVTFRPNTEGGVTSVGEKMLADGVVNLSTVTKTPSIRTQDAHQFALDVFGSPSIEWHIEGLQIDSTALGHRRGGVRFSNAPTRDSYLDRCFLRDMSGGGGNMIYGGDPGVFGGGGAANGGKIYVRACTMANSDAFQLWWDASAAYMLGCTVRMDRDTLFDGASEWWHTQFDVKAYGNAFYSDTEPGSRIAINFSAAKFFSDYNVSNFTNTDWTTYFDGAADLNGSTRAAMFVSTTDHNPLVGGTLDGAVDWASLPADVQAAWPDTDFYGATITKSGTLTAGAIYLEGAGGPAPAEVTASLADEADAVVATSTAQIGAILSLADQADAVDANAAVQIAAVTGLSDQADAATLAAGIRVDLSAALVDQVDTASVDAAVEVGAVVGLVDQADAVDTTAQVDIAASGALIDDADSAAATALCQVDAVASLPDQGDAVAGSAGVQIDAVVATTDDADALSAAITPQSGYSAALLDELDAAGGVIDVLLSGGATLADASDAISASGEIVVLVAAALVDSGDTASGTWTAIYGFVGALVDGDDAVSAATEIAVFGEIALSGFDTLEAFVAIQRIVSLPPATRTVFSTQDLRVVSSTRGSRVAVSTQEPRVVVSVAEPGDVSSI